MVMDRTDVALFFEKSIKCVVQAAVSQRGAALKTISVRPLVDLVKYAPVIWAQHIVLVGGFSSSDWLYSQVSDALTPLGLQIIRPDNHVCVTMPFMPNTTIAN